MNKKLLVISTSLRTGSNSDILSDEFMKGAKDTGNIVEKVILSNKEIKFCRGCLACQSKETGQCVIQDDANEIISKMAAADVIAFATPIYFYEMSGQMKTLLDRTNPLFPIEYSFKDIYLITTAAESEKSAMDGAIKGLSGWIECFDKAKLSGVIYGTEAVDAKSILENKKHLEDAFMKGQDI